jgi:CDP-diacylglycerol--serine O-phosphatidyltransferase
MVKTRRLRRGIYLLPTLFTVGNLLCGYASLIHGLRGEIGRAALFILFAGVLDMLDGRIARFTGTSTEFGRQFDSLADITSFGIAPALLGYQWVLVSFGRLGWFIAFLFVVCAAMRLARFNIQASVAEKRHFAGLPSPPAACMLACVAFAFPATSRDGWASVALALLVSCLALLMISRLRYRSFKEVNLNDRRSYVYVLPLAAIMVAVVIYPKWTLLSVSAAYLVSAPAAYLWSLKGRAGEKTEVADEPVFR